MMVAMPAAQVTALVQPYIRCTYQKLESCSGTMMQDQRPPSHPRATSTCCNQVSAIDTKCLCYLYSLYDQGQTIEVQQSSGDSQSAMCSNSLTSHVLDNKQELYTPKSVFQGKN